MAFASRRRASRALIGLGALGLLLAGCGGQSTPSSTASSTASSTSTTTTTLPRPVGIALTQPNGTFAFLGPVLRMSVVSPALGAAVLPPAPTELGATLPSVRIAYRQFGSGPNLLLVMGERGTMTWWDPGLLQALAADFTVTIFDLPGVGYSGAAPVPLSLAEEGDVTAGLALSLGLEQQPGKPSSGVTFLGWGSGGDVALAAVERHPGVAKGLVLLDTPAPGSLEVRAGPAVTAAFASTLATVTGLSRLLFPADAPSARSEWLERIAQLPPDDETAPSVVAQASLAAAVGTDTALQAGLKHLRLPVQIMTGDLDRVVPPANATALNHAIAHSRLLILNQAGYGAIVSDETQVLAALVAFVG